jgi:hypothetical protein
MFKRTRPLMLEVYDTEKTAALLKKAREITAGLKSEMGEIASQISRVLDGREEDADGIDALASDQQEQGRSHHHSSNDVTTAPHGKIVLAVLAIAGVQGVCARASGEGQHIPRWIKRQADMGLRDRLLMAEGRSVPAKGRR